MLIATAERGRSKLHRDDILVMNHSGLISVNNGWQKARYLRAFHIEDLRYA